MENENKEEKEKVEEYLKSGKFSSDYFFKRIVFIVIGGLIYFIYKACTGGLTSNY